MSKPVTNRELAIRRAMLPAATQPDPLRAGRVQLGAFEIMARENAARGHWLDLVLAHYDWGKERRHIAELLARHACLTAAGDMELISSNSALGRIASMPSGTIASAVAALERADLIVTTRQGIGLLPHHRHLFFRDQHWPEVETAAAELIRRAVGIPNVLLAIHADCLGNRQFLR